MAAALNAALLVALFGPQALGSPSSGGRVVRYTAQGWIAGALLGIAILGKGFVPVVLIAPVFLVARGKRTQMLIASAAVAAPWFLLCLAMNGSAFWNDFFWKQHVLRFFSSELEHVQPLWWYVPVLLAGLFPWTPFGAADGKPARIGRRTRSIFVDLSSVGIHFLFGSTNKLPAYVLPLMPGMAIVMAVALDRSKYAARWLVVCALLLMGGPVIASILPDALNTGITHVQLKGFLGWQSLLILAIPIAAAASAWWLATEDAEQEWSGRRKWSALVVAAAAVLSLGYLKWSTFPVLDQNVSVRAFWQTHKAEVSGACVAGVGRTPLYGLNYYAERPLAECARGQRPRVVMRGGSLAVE